MRNPWLPGLAGSPARAPGGDPAAGPLVAARRTRSPGIHEIRVLCLSLCFLACLFAPLTAPGQWVLSRFFTERSRCGPNAAASLKTLAVAEVDFRSNDRDGNGVNDFWRGDVAGLYGLCPTGTTEMVKLLELSVAGADVSALDPRATPPAPGKMAGQTYYTNRAPKAGYWLLALRHEGEALPSPDRFAFCCFPAQYGKTGRRTFIIDESNTIYSKDLQGRALVSYPADPLADGWTRLD